MTTGVAYLVVSGYHDAWDVRAVFTARELAERWIAARRRLHGPPRDSIHGTDEYEIEEYPLDPDASR